MALNRIYIFFLIIKGQYLQLNIKDKDQFNIQIKENVKKKKKKKQQLSNNRYNPLARVIFATFSRGYIIKKGTPPIQREKKK